jgi:hypothetical protein
MVQHVEGRKPEPTRHFRSRQVLSDFSSESLIAQKAHCVAA